VYPDGKGFAFEYNAAGRRTRRVGHDGYTLNYAYDAAGRLASLTAGATNELVRYTYDTAGRLSREDKGNGTYTTYAYDAAGQVLAMTNRAPNGSAHSFFNYVYDSRGNRTSMTTAEGVTAYQYDAINQLIGVTYPGGRTVTYAYDAAGNRTVVTENGTQTVYSANNLNQYTAAGAATFTYDADGNMTSKTEGGQTTTYTYDAENRLVGIQIPTHGEWQYTYDALGNRTTVIHGGVTNRCLHDPIGLVNVAVEYDGSGGLVARYDHALGLVSRTDSTSNSAFYAFDAIGSTRELTGNAGTIVSSYNYDALGATTLNNEAIPNEFRFVGRFGLSDESTDLHFMRARYYNSDLSRFTSQDPSGLGGGDPNLYRYVLNAPLRFLDPTGLDTWTISILALTIAGGSDNHGGNYVGMGVGVGLPSMKIKGGSTSVPWEFSFSGVAFGASYSKAEAKSGIYGGAWGGCAFPGMEKAPPYWGRSFDPGNPLGPEKGILVGIGAEAGVYGLVRLPTWLPPSVLTPVGVGSTPVVIPRDPNDKLGPTGVGPDRLISGQDEMEYMIRFENHPTATAPVQDLVVVDYLDPNLDWSTVELGEIRYGDRVITVPAGQLNFSTRDLPPTNSIAIMGITQGRLAVDITATLNAQNGRMEWHLKTLDTQDNKYPDDALAGILPPNNTNTHCGEGHLTFRVKPKVGLAIGTRIENKAAIVFDTNDPIETPAIFNTIGQVDPKLAASISYLASQMIVGIPFSYTVTVANSGISVATNVVITNAIPEGFTYVSATGTVGTVTYTNGAVVWAVGDLANDMPASLTVTLVPTQVGDFTFPITGGGGGVSFDFHPFLNVQPNPDADGDGMPDAWEVTVFGNTTIAGPGTDFDHDGASDHDERIAGTNPKDPADYLAIRQFSVTGASGYWVKRLCWEGTNAAPVQLERADRPDGPFAAVGVADSQNRVAYDTLPQVTASAFYRLTATNGTPEDLRIISFGPGGSALRTTVGWSSASNRVYDLYRWPAGVSNMTAAVTNILATPPMNVITDHVPSAMGILYRIGVREP
ncbi:MAG: RHS repeat-associated core domain-containing protein, partial [bacterium]